MNAANLLRALVSGLAALALSLAPSSSNAWQAVSDHEAIQGTWVCVAVLKDGKQVQEHVGVKAVMHAGRLTWMFPTPEGSFKSMAATYSVDASQNPKRFDWHPLERPNEVHRRLYVLAGDTLIWSASLGAGPPPEHFNAGQWQFIMKRERGAG